MLQHTLRAAICAAVLASTAALAKAPVVITTIKPLQSLMAQLTEGLTEPVLLIKEGSPHGYQLKPSDAKAIANADLVVWTSDDLETVIPETAEKAGVKHALVWAEIPGIKLLPNRKGGLWDDGDDDHDHDHADSGFSHGDAHNHDKHGHDEHEHHHHGANNPHLWLSTENAAILLKAAAAELQSIDPEHKAQYQANLDKALAGLTKLHDELQTQLKPYSSSPFMVFHDAYPYFEKEYDLHPVGVIRADPEHEPGAARIAELRKAFTENRIKCVFNEPEFPSALAAKLAADTNVKQAELDPVGANIPAGPAMYGKLMHNIADNLSDCLGKK